MRPLANVKPESLADAVERPMTRDRVLEALL